MNKLVENYLLLQPIGKGVYGKVYKTVHQKTKELFAVKVIPKQSFRSNPKLEQLAINEINILSSLKHQNIVRFIETLKTPNNFYFVYEYCNQGTIQNMLQKKKFFKENEALIIFKQLLEAFKQLNKNNIMHRDLKPDNIFMSDGKVKLGDFGFCKMLQVNMAQTMLGSPIYMAPQILREQIYTSKADIWSLGVVLFELLFGYCPFESNSISQLINVIKESQLSIPKQINPISEKAQGLIRKMLVKDQFKRIEWVDLFQYKIDDSGNIISDSNKQMGIEALQKYFLNDVRSTGQIPIDEVENPSQILINQKVASMSLPIKQQSTLLLKKIVSQQFNPNSVIKTDVPSKLAPSVNQFNLSQTKDFSIRKSQSLNQQLREPNSLYKEKQMSLYQKHTCWEEAINTILQLSQRNTIQNDRCIYWVATALLDRLNAESKHYPEWTDVIMQEKEQICLIIKQVEHLESKDSNSKNQILKIWSKGAIKDEKSWEKAVRFIFNQEENQIKTIQEILLS